MAFGLWANRAAVLLVALPPALGCAVHRNPVPLELAHSARVPDMPAIRTGGLKEDPRILESVTDSIRQERETGAIAETGGPGHYKMLALSGGGSDGAFGAGFLCGWTAAGDRPVFKIVTGVSTGALIAPFAFLGPKYDDVLRETYTGVSARDIYTSRRLLSLPWSDSLTNDTPLRRLVQRSVTPEVLADVAAAHARGRRLFVGSTDLDTMQFVVWDMGAIAASGRPEALDLFRQVLLASASIPALFPPQFIRVEAGGKPYDEMHVDGGTCTNMFFFGQEPLAAASGGRAGGDRLYVIRNSLVALEPRVTAPRLLPIIQQATWTEGKYATVGDFYRMYAAAQRFGYELVWTCIPDNYVRTTDKSFDTEEMRRMFVVGCRLAGDPAAWRTAPPFSNAADPSRPLAKAR